MRGLGGPELPKAPGCGRTGHSPGASPDGLVFVRKQTSLLFRPYTSTMSFYGLTSAGYENLLPELLLGLAGYSGDVFQGPNLVLAADVDWVTPPER